MYAHHPSDDASRRAVVRVCKDWVVVILVIARARWPLAGLVPAKSVRAASFTFGPAIVRPGSAKMQVLCSPALSASVFILLFRADSSSWGVRRNRRCAVPGTIPGEDTNQRERILQDFSRPQTSHAVEWSFEPTSPMKYRPVSKSQPDVYGFRSPLAQHPFGFFRGGKLPAGNSPSLVMRTMQPP